MPIYDLQINEQTRVGESDAINYFESGDAQVTRVLHFGFGDISISTGQQIGEDIERVLMFTESEPHPIGAPDNDLIGESLVPPVKMYFEKPESIDVVISELTKLKAAWPAQTSTDTSDTQPEQEVDNGE